jgi:hypothetical protein
MRKIVFLIIAFVAISTFIFAQANSGHLQNPPSPKMVKSVINPHKDSGCNYLILADNLPWGSNAVAQILTTNGETFSTANSGTFPGLDFSLFDVIIVLSDQVPAFHTVFAANFPKFVTFVQAGGTLEVHAATCGWNSPCGYSVQLPGGVHTHEQYDNYNNVAGVHPITTGVSNPFSGTYASHGYFSGLVAGTDIITTASSNGEPTTIQYHYGAGVVTATTCTYEYGCNNGQEACTMLHNNLNYACSHAINATVPTLSQWGLIFLGLALLGFGTFYILKMRG